MTISKKAEIANASRYPSRRLNQRERKVVEVSEQYEASTPSDWSSNPATIGEALDSLASGAVASAEVSGSISSSEVLALNGSPIEAIPAPGAGKAIIVEEIELFLDFNSTAYVADAGEDLTVQYATGGVDIATWDNDSDDILVGTADERRLNKPTMTDVLDLSTIDNEAVEITIATGEVASGDSPLKYRIKYKVVTLLV